MVQTCGSFWYSFGMTSEKYPHVSGLSGKTTRNTIFVNKMSERIGYLKSRGEKSGLPFIAD